jgi:hypothetical protein
MDLPNRTQQLGLILLLTLFAVFVLLRLARGW